MATQSINAKDARITSAFSFWQLMGDPHLQLALQCLNPLPPILLLFVFVPDPVLLPAPECSTGGGFTAPLESRRNSQRKKKKENRERPGLGGHSLLYTWVILSACLEAPRTVCPQFCRWRLTRWRDAIKHSLSRRVRQLWRKQSHICGIALHAGSPRHCLSWGLSIKKA